MTLVGPRVGWSLVPLRVLRPGAGKIIFFHILGAVGAVCRSPAGASACQGASRGGSWEHFWWLARGGVGSLPPLPFSACCLASFWKEYMAFLRSFYVADDIWRIA